MNFDLQTKLENEKVFLLPLQETDFDDLFLVASDPKVWEQHPNKERYKFEHFKNFFDGAIKSKGAFKIVEKNSMKIIGCTRFYDFNEENDSILICYTFYGREYWGKGFNLSVKKLMLDYAFKYVSEVDFHIGAENIRSQIAIGRLGTTKIAEEEIAYFGEDSKLNFIYRITKREWAHFLNLNPNLQSNGFN